MDLENIGTFILITLVAFITGVLFGMNTARTNDRYVMNKAGIKHIVKCNNTQSNWYEIVWFDDKQERVYKNED